MESWKILNVKEGEPGGDGDKGREQEGQTGSLAGGSVQACCRSHSSARKETAAASEIWPSASRGAALTLRREM